MKRIGRTAVFGLALVLSLGLAVSATQAAKSKKVKTEAELESFRFPENTLEFFGDVHSKQSKCEKGREITLVYRGPEPVTDPVVGTDVTDGTGDWEVRPTEVAFVGDYAVEVDRKKIERHGKKLVCKATTSPDKLIEK